MTVSQPSTENGTVTSLPPRRRGNKVVRTREHLTEAEVGKLIKAAGSNRYGNRDATMILIAFKHGLRVSELVNMQWTDVHFESQQLEVRRLKGSISGKHPLEGDELRALRKLRRESEGQYVFMSERGAPITAAAFRKMLTRIADDAGLASLRIHPHMLRHACGSALANNGTDTLTLQAYMGHARVQSTVGYCALNASRFRGLWRK